MKNLIKKNQLMITALAIMIAIAGYLHFAGPDLDEEYLTANDEGQITSEVDEAGDLLAGLTDIDSMDSDVDIIVDDYLDGEMQTQTTDGTIDGTDVTVASGEDGQLAEVVEPEEGEVPGTAVFTSTNGTTILSEAKLLKEQVRAKNKETLLEIINSTGLTDEQKQEAVDAMVEMTAVAEKEAAAEILLEAKGFHDVVVSINDGAVDVVVNTAVLDDAMRAQIEDIVTRKTEVSAENIIISTVVQ